jgi:hypothetical protein
MHEIAELDMSREDRIAAKLTGSRSAILLDPDRVEQNLLYFMNLRETIQTRVGEADYIDLRWRDRISVMPATFATQGGSR